ncbi:ribonuclease Z [Paenibacillus antri]|uniref:Ribonuclease Z n=1 Tax=Paenibacillus antri TaxID=2582848 RepID=A0A5R9G2A0_9BACL|nr:MBL fold metallo-hydrolase [Paenibacillus antri]TLS48280.1 ribonuclease Z [Paenibacillus antri]
MSIRIQMIGTGNAFAKKYFNNNAIVVANGYRLLVDCGVTAPYALYRAGIGVQEIDGVLVTHIHGDHIGGIEELAFALMYVHKKKIPLFVPSSIREALWETSLKGALEDLSTGCDSLDCYFDVVEIDEGVPFEISDGFVLELIRTLHIPNKPSYALLLNEIVFYSSDMTFDPALLTDLTNAGRCKHILHECQLTGPGLVHTTLDELLTLPEAIQERIWLMHYADNRDDYVGKTGAMRFIEQQTEYEFE